MPRHNSDRRAPRPLDPARLEAMAVHYVGRYATTRAKLEAYLRRKIDQRGWSDGPPADVAGLVERFTALGYIDDAAFAEMRAAALTRRGYGGRRIDSALRAAGIAEQDREGHGRLDEDAALASALILARRRRIGPFGPQPADRQAQERAIAVLLRGGHDYEVARRVAAMTADALGDDVKD